MFTKTVLAALAVSAAQAIELFPAHQEARRELQARQTASDDYGDYGYPACATALYPIYDTLPSLPADILSYELTATDAGDACAPTYPPAISSELRDYESDVLDWYSSHSAAIRSVLADCPQYSSEFDGTLSETATYNYCSDTSLFGGDDDATATATATDDDDDDDDDSTTATATATATDKTTVATTTGKTTAATTEATTPAGQTTATATAAATANAGPRETAYLGAAAVAVAGFLGAAMAL